MTEPSESMDTASAEQQLESDNVPRGKWKSGRWWKEPTKRDSRMTGIVKSKALKSSWEKKQKEKALKEQFKAQKQVIKDRLAAEKQAIVQARKEKEERKKANERKAEIVQVIRNTTKLKKAKKKDLRKIEKRDTNNM
ncbi:hypothetical protein FO519_004547 [Halicephalobus sp. NKZ332]|nr:hypothetical protein FO519_004547 [Halicephalobus sp. NKZ332]